MRIAKTFSKIAARRRKAGTILSSPAGVRSMIPIRRKNNAFSPRREVRIIPVVSQDAVGPRVVG